MRKMTASALFLCGIAIASAQAAQAGNTVRFQGKDLPPTRWFQSNQEIQILKTGPTVRDLRYQDDEPTYEVRVPALPPVKSSRIIVTPNTEAASFATSSPGTVTISPKPLAPAGFTTNMPSAGLVHPTLPNGTTTNRLGRQNWNTGSMIHPSTAPTQASHLQPSRSTKPKEVATYEPITAPGASGSTTTTIKSNLHGQLLLPKQAQAATY